MSKHTPGPWFAHGQNILNSASRRGDDCRQVASVSDLPSSEMTADELAANARLIAAAPELLAALQAIVDEAGPLAGLNDGPGTVNRISRMARAAIAKATA